MPVAKVSMRHGQLGQSDVALILQSSSAELWALADRGSRARAC